MNNPDSPRPYRTSRYDRPDRGRYPGDERDDYDDRPRYHLNPRQMVQGPGLAMAIVGWSGLVLTALTLLILALVGAMDPLPRAEFYFRAIVIGVFGLISLAMFAIVAVGGQSMRRCRHYGVCMTAAILLIATILLLGLASVFTLPFGIWALVVLCNSEVKREFTRPPRQTREVDGGWEGRR
jgi:hypothetical protein